MPWLWVLGGALACVVVICMQQYRAARGVYRPLSRRQPARRTNDTPDLGLEAIDMDAVKRTQRRNESLERGQTNWSRGYSATSAADTDVQPLCDDETYSARYHAAFHSRKKNKDRSQ